MDKHSNSLKEIGFDSNNGIGDFYSKCNALNEDKRNEIKDDIMKVYDVNPHLAMVDSDNGITNLHCPSDIIIDASMPVVVRDSGKMWTPDNKLKDCNACIPDRSYAGIYKAIVEFVKKNGQFDVKTMGSVPNVGLMAQKAEEYGSHDKTFKPISDGVIQIVNSKNEVLMEQKVETGDIYRSCQTKDAPIRDFVKLACNRSRASNWPVIFWLDEERAHDRNIIKLVNT